MGNQGVLDPECKAGQRTALDSSLRRRRRAELNRPFFEWNGIFEKWSRGFVRRNFWRVSATFLSEEDALQECVVVFLHCRNKYAGKLDEPQHLMALYKTALTRAWHTYASKDPHFRCSFVEDDTKQLEAVEPDSGESVWDQRLASFATEVDNELRAMITAIISAPDEFLAIMFSGNDTKMISRRIARMFGIKAGERDLVAELRKLVGGTSAHEMMYEFATNALMLR